MLFFDFIPSLFPLINYPLWISLGAVLTPRGFVYFLDCVYYIPLTLIIYSNLKLYCPSGISTALTISIVWTRVWTILQYQLFTLHSSLFNGHLSLFVNCNKAPVRAGGVWWILCVSYLTYLDDLSRTPLHHPLGSLLTTPSHLLTAAIESDMESPIGELWRGWSVSFLFLL